MAGTETDVLLGRHGDVDLEECNLLLTRKYWFNI